MSDKLTRREFIKEIGLLTGLAFSGFGLLENKSYSEDVDSSAKIPKRVLGRTGVQVSTLALGMGPIGISRLEQPVVNELINLCIDLGINYIDVAPNYGDGEEKLGPIMKSRRDEVFLVTKVEEQTKEGALKQVNESLKKMQTDHVDVVHLHDFGGFNADLALGKDGALAGLLEAKKSGLTKFIGVSGHQRPATFLKVIETDEIDLVMCVLNFVDKHTYDFESKVLPTAIKHKAGISAMKVLGGAVGMQYDKPMPALLPKEYYTNAIRYSLSIKGVSTLVIGLKNKDEIVQAVDNVKNYKPLSDDERQAIEQIGKDLAKQWGAHFGPVV